MTVEQLDVRIVGDVGRRAYFHRGVPGLNPGDLILPSATTGQPSSADHGAEHVCRRDRVYLAAAPALALIYTAMYPAVPHGGLYEVEPIGDVEHDDDWMGEPGLSVAAASARVVAVLDPEALLNDATIPELRMRLLASAGWRAPGRNEPCYCGSGVKFKRCHGR